MKSTNQLGVWGALLLAACLIGYAFSAIARSFLSVLASFPPLLFTRRTRSMPDVCPFFLIAQPRAVDYYPNIITGN
jgi:hypothetical protein